MNGSGEKSNGGTAENFPSQGFHASLTFNYFISSTAVFRIFTRWFYALELEGDYFYKMLVGNAPDAATLT